MRIVVSCLLAALIAASSVCVLPSRADAYTYSHLVYFLAREGCAGQSSYAKNGCYSYLEHRMLHCKASNAALRSCNSQCDEWFSPSSQAGGNAKCKQGCQFLRGKE